MPHDPFCAEAVASTTGRVLGEYSGGKGGGLGLCAEAMHSLCVARYVKLGIADRRGRPFLQNYIRMLVSRNVPS